MPCGVAIFSTADFIGLPTLDGVVSVVFAETVLPCVRAVLRFGFCWVLKCIARCSQFTDKYLFTGWWDISAVGCNSCLVSLISLWSGANWSCDSAKIGEVVDFARGVLRDFHSRLKPNEWYRGVMLHPQKISPANKVMRKFFTLAISMKHIVSHYGISQQCCASFTENRKLKNFFGNPNSTTLHLHQYHETQKVTNRALTLLRW